MKQKFNLLYTIIIALFSFILVACHENDDERIDYDQIAPHTLLLYLNADSNLSGSLQYNAREAQKAIKDSLMIGAINLVIFHDYRTPKLYWVHKNAKNDLDTIPLKEYDSAVNACSKDIFKEVIDLTFNGKFKNSKMKGVIFGGHGFGWTPSQNYKAASTRATSSPEKISSAPELQYIGADELTGVRGETGYLELWDFCDVFKETNVKLDYFFFDACQMGNIETIYEMRHMTDYVVGAVTEILGDGFPYRKVVTYLGNVTNKDQLPEALIHSMDGYYTEYSMESGAVISLYDMKYVESLYNQFFTLLNNSPQLEKLKYLLQPENMYEALDWQSDFQQFGRRFKNSQYMFYDFGQFIEYLAAGRSDLGDKLLEGLDNFEFTYYTDHFFDIEIKACSGITISLPQCFNLLSGSKPASFMSAYEKTEWGKEMLRILNQE